jgi:hypothetical protein
VPKIVNTANLNFLILVERLGIIIMPRVHSLRQLCNGCNLQLKGCRRKVKHSKPEKLTAKKSRQVNDFYDILEISKNDDESSKNSYQFKIPVIAHNLSRYDAKFIFQYFNPRIAAKFGKNADKYPPNVEITALNLEQFISFDIFYLRFIDSVKFLSASLESLVDNLIASCDEPFDKFIHTNNHMKPQDDEIKQLLFSKGVFPYEYFSSLEKFNDTCLPPKECFYNHLKEEGISDEDYDRAHSMWTKFGCQTFKDYHDLYLKTDVLLLADVFEYFRKLGHESYGLDAAMFLTLPAFSWDCCLKFTEAKLELITDPEIHLLFENNIRGGISTISHRYARSNVPNTPNFIPENDPSYLLYIDANNLYGWAMSEKLPTGNFKFLTPDEIETFNVEDIPDDSKTGYVLECDLEYPPELHEDHNCYPLAPESLIITEDLLSPYCRSFNTKHIPTRKLVPNLMNKTKYVTHYRNLKFYLESGLKLGKIHRILSFDQSEWMKPYIDFNTRKRQESKTKVGQDFFKISVNSIFGKSMENIRNRKHVQLVSNPFKIKQLISKPQLEQFRIVNDDTVLIDRVRNKVVLNKPIYCGFAILELSKLLMYRFHYDVIKKRYGSQAKLLFTDTDSLTYHITTPNLYDDMKGFREYLDTSNYPPDHELFSLKNAKVLGLFKDECSGNPPIEYIGLRAKMYSLLVEEDKPAKMTAKGIKRSYVKKHVRHEMYLHTLRTKTVTHAKFRLFRSRAQIIQTVEVNKICLNARDDKRYILDDGVCTLAYGHFKIKK